MIKGNKEIRKNGKKMLLVAGCWLLVAGCWLLVARCWLLVAGCWLLVKLFQEFHTVNFI